MSLDAVVAGHVCLDIIPALPRGARFVPGQMIEIDGTGFAAGGAVANTGVALHRLGVRVRLVGRVGADHYGDLVQQILAGHAAHLAEALYRDRTTATAHTYILSVPGTDRVLVHHAGTNATFRGTDVSDATLAATRALHLGYPPTLEQLYRDDGAGTVALLGRARAAGVTTSVDMTQIDPAGRTGAADWPTILRRMLPLTDLFLPSVGEMLQLLDPLRWRQVTAHGDAASLLPAHDVAALGRSLLAMGPALVVLKCGARGLYLCSASAARIAAAGHAAPRDAAAWADRELWVPAYPADVVGTNGAGDAAIAGLLMGVLRGFGLSQSLDAAVAVGACSVEHADATAGVPGWPAIEQRIAAGWQRDWRQVPGPAWGRDIAAGWWRGPRDGAPLHVMGADDE